MSVYYGGLSRSMTYGSTPSRSVSDWSTGGVPSPGGGNGHLCKRIVSSSKGSYRCPSGCLVWFFLQELSTECSLYFPRPSRKSG